MKMFLKKFLFAMPLAGALALHGADADEKKAAANDPVKITQGTNGETILTLDDATQKRIGLEAANLVATAWQPELKAFGHVVDPAPLMDLLMEFGRAEMTFDSSHQELERAKQLKKDNNISERAFQDAEATYKQNFAAVSVIYQKISATWGRRIPEMLGPLVVPPGTERKPDKFLRGFPDQVMFILVDLPAGERLQNAASSARIISLAEKTPPVAADYFDKLPALDSQSQQQGILFAAFASATNQLVPGEAVKAFIRSSEPPVSGVTIPASAVLRHEGKSWVFVQTGANDFSRREISTDHAVADGFFSAELSPTNRVVVTGAQTLLSAEMSGGNFNSGQRD